MVSPSKDSTCRPLDRMHVEQLKIKIKQDPLLKHGVLLCQTKNNSLKARKSDILEGRLLLEVIGGNHTRVALQELMNDPDFLSKDLLKSWPCQVYQGLNNIECLHLAVGHNTANETAKLMTFEDFVYLIREQWLKAERVDNTWKKNLVSILNVKDRRQLTSNFKNHLSAAKQPESTWVLLQKIFKMWSANEIVGQPKKKINQMTFKSCLALPFEEKNGLLQKLMVKQITYKKFKEISKKKNVDSTALFKKSSVNDGLGPLAVSSEMNLEEQQLTISVSDEIESSSVSSEIHFDEQPMQTQTPAVCSGCCDKEEIISTLNNTLRENSKMQTQTPAVCSGCCDKEEIITTLNNTLTEKIQEITSLRKKIKRMESVRSFTTKEVETNRKRQAEDAETSASKKRSEDRNENSALASEGSLVVLDWGEDGFYLGKVLKESNVVSTKSSLQEAKSSLSQGRIPKELLTFNASDVTRADLKYLVVTIPEHFLKKVTEKKVEIKNDAISTFCTFLLQQID